MSLVFIMFMLMMILGLFTVLDESGVKLHLPKRKPKTVVAKPKPELEADPNKIRAMERELGIVTLDDLDAPIIQDSPNSEPTSLDEMHPLPLKYKWLITESDGKIIIAIADSSEYAAFSSAYGPNGGQRKDDGYFSGHNRIRVDFKTLVGFMREQDYVYSWTYQLDPEDNHASLRQGSRQLVNKLNALIRREEAETKRQAELRDFVNKAAGRQDRITVKPSPGLRKPKA